MIIHDTMNNVVHEKVIKKTIPNSSQTAELYGVPENHKINVPLRPIVSACGDPLDKLTWFLERIITQLLPFIPAHLKKKKKKHRTIPINTERLPTTIQTPFHPAQLSSPWMSKIYTVTYPPKKSSPKSTA